MEIGKRSPFFIFTLVLNILFFLNFSAALGANTGQIFYKIPDRIPNANIMDSGIGTSANDNVSGGGLSTNEALAAFSTLSILGGITAIWGGSGNSTHPRSETPPGNTVLYAATYAQGILQSEDSGKNWNNPSNNMLQGSNTNVQYVMDVKNGSNDILFSATSGYGVNKSIDGGKTWTEANTGLNLSTNDKYVYSLVNADGTLYIATRNGIYKSINLGESWTSASTGITWVRSLMYVRNVGLFAGAFSGLYRSTDGGATWTQEITGNSVYGIVNAGGSVLYAGVYGSGVYKSIDGGNSWNKVSVTSALQNVRYLLYTDGVLYAGTFLNEVYKSTNGGINWTKIFSDETESYVNYISQSDNLLFIAIEGGGLYSAPIDDDTNWTQDNVISVTK